MFSPQAKAVWGKTDSKSGSWLPLHQHLVDAASMAEVLWQRWLPRSITDRLSEHFGSESVASGVACLAAGSHDLGKCAPAFQAKAERAPGFDFLASRLRQLGFDLPPLGPRPTPHGLMGQVVVQRLLIEAGANRSAASSFAEVIGAHHGRPVPRIAVRRVPPADLGQGLWHETRVEIWQAMVERSGFTDLSVVFKDELPMWARVQLNALVVVADWMSSNIEVFPYQVTPDRFMEALAALELPERWRPPVSDSTAAELLVGRFPHLAKATIQPLQQASVDAARNLQSPGLLILEAPMGSGKTEAALLAAEELAARFGSGGVFVALPTMATANPMFSRVAAWLAQIPDAGRTALNLVHSKAALQPEFRSMMYGRFSGIADDDAGSEVFVSAWFRGRRRAALATHVVGTIDQALFGSLRAKHVMLRQLALTTKVVVLDEIHAADDFMGIYLHDVLAWLGHHRVPVVLMSATLPPAQRDELASAYATGYSGLPARLVLPSSGGYPRLTVVDKEAADWPVAAQLSNQAVTLRSLDDGVGEVVSLVQELISEGGCVGIICSTVRRAQERYIALRDAGLCEVVLAHSKFAAPHRAQRESDLVSRLGPRGARPDRLIVVGTQVLEQSLDIDFDVLVSDIAPMDLLLQRIGRLHRHSGRQRPPRVASPVCYVTGVTSWGAEVPEFDRGVGIVYGRWPLMSALATLGGLPATIALPADIPDLVSEAYDESRDAPEGWADPWLGALTRHQDKRAKQRMEASSFALPWPTHAIDLADWADELASDPEAPKQAARAQVRDTDESLEVIMITRDSDGNPRVLDGVEDCSGAIIPRPLGERDGHLARAVASCTVSLPRGLTHPGVIDATLDALERPPLDVSHWQSSPWLAGQLLLVLDSDGRATVGETTVAYDRELGLREVK